MPAGAAVFPPLLLPDVAPPPRDFDRRGSWPSFAVADARALSSEPDDGVDKLLASSDLGYTHAMETRRERERERNSLEHAVPSLANVYGISKS